MKKPTPPTGNGPIATWVRGQLLPYIHSLELVGIIGGKKVANAHGGYSLVVAAGQSSPSAPTEVEPFRLQSHYSGYLACRKMNGGETGTLDAATTYIMRPYKLRPVSSWQIDGLTWSYTYSADLIVRVASASGQASETQVIVPRYLGPYVGHAGDVIYALRLQSPIATISVGEIETPVEYIDLNLDGRAWAKENG